MTQNTNAQILICGSMAFDTIMVFEGQFKEHILPDQVHRLNVAFLVPQLNKQWGGCAGNIAYGVAQLGGAALPMATLGHDGQAYVERFAQLGIPTFCLRTIADAFTAQAFITTDLDDNQITAFHPGAMLQSHVQTVFDAKTSLSTQGLSPIGIGIVAPCGKTGMWEHAQQLAELKIPFVFDPGQGLPMFNGDELQQLLQWSSYAVVNDYEAQLLCDKTGQSLETLAHNLNEHGKALIVTLGSQGSRVYEQGQQFTVPCVKATNLQDPTGCGDAYRAGLLVGLSKGLPLLAAAQLGSVMGSIKIAYKGGQEYHVDRTELKQLCQSHYGFTPNWL